MNLNPIFNLSIMPTFSEKLPEVGDILLQIKPTTSPTRPAGTLVTVGKVTDNDMFLKDDTGRWSRKLSLWNYYILLSTIPYSHVYRYYVENSKVYSTDDRLPKTKNARSINLLRADTIAYVYRQNLFFIENPTLYDVLGITLDYDKIYYINGTNQTQGFEPIIELLSTRI